ncbi:MAG: hypothetical protein Q8O51_01165 [bacterium]|nr:hypothetical protein [bacterium]
MCAEGDTFFAVVDTGHGQKSIQLKATTFTDAAAEVAEKGIDGMLLYIQSGHCAPT